MPICQLLVVAMAATPNTCQPRSAHPFMPIFHIIGNVTTDSATGAVTSVEDINDVSSIFLWKPLLYRLVTIEKVIVLDLDLALVGGSDIRQLWNEFSRFQPAQLLGMVAEQGPTYRRAARAGVNGGVQLQHLFRMRATSSGSSGGTGG